jgi:hypothetical protein
MTAERYSDVDLPPNFADLEFRSVPVVRDGNSNCCDFIFKESVISNHYAIGLCGTDVIFLICQAKIHGSLQKFCFLFSVFIYC